MPVVCNALAQLQVGVAALLRGSSKPVLFIVAIAARSKIEIWHQRSPIDPTSMRRLSAG